MLPCKVILSGDNAGSAETPAVDPLASMQTIANPELGTVTSQVRDKLKRVIESSAAVD